MHYMQNVTWYVHRIPYEGLFTNGCSMHYMHNVTWPVMDSTSSDVTDPPQGVSLHPRASALGPCHFTELTGNREDGILSQGTGRSLHDRGGSSYRRFCWDSSQAASGRIRMRGSEGFCHFVSRWRPT
uniref:Uncharacterized protein n=1 Tax=Molossus molossus TaxID=27622 RepID=A0A7J8DPM2_MOLMO|nr:hypothetical protein HJG59_009216 [Molossus molossus]